MKKMNQSFYKELVHIALPISIQSLFQSSLCIIDQMMVGSLGSVSVASVGLGGKFASLFSVTVAALCTAAGILMAQYYGAKDIKGLRQSFSINMVFAMIVSLLFTGVAFSIPSILMHLYSTDQPVIEASSQYLRILSIGFIPMTITLMFSTLFRSIGETKLPMYASISSVVFNTVLNYMLIYGKWGCPALGLQGAAIATTLSRIIESIILLVGFMKVKQRMGLEIRWEMPKEVSFLKKVWQIIYPILICEFLWGLGENIYASIYGRLGTISCAAMTLTGPIQSLVIGTLSGVSAATGIMVGKRLGAKEIEEAYESGKRFIKIGFLGAICFSVLVVMIAPFYSQIFNVEPEAKIVTIRLLSCYALFIPIKVLNMIAEGGILRSGGKTHYTLILDAIGTWGIGVPLGFLGAQIFKLPIEQVYFMLSLEEVFRLVMTLILFKQRKWIDNLTDTKLEEISAE